MSIKNSLKRKRSYLGLAKFWASPKTNFVIFCQGRTGSTLLVDLLNSHKDIFCDGEIFHRELFGKVSSPFNYINGRGRLAGKSAYGFKVKVYQLKNVQEIEDVPKWMNDLNQSGFKIIYLQRQNIFRHALSSVFAEKTAIWHVSKGEKATAQVEVDLIDLAKKMKGRERYLRQEKQVLKQIEHLHLRYEKDLLPADKHQETADKVFEVLGLKSVNVNSNLRRTIEDNWEARVTNPDEVREFLNDQNYAHFL